MLSERKLMPPCLELASLMVRISSNLLRGITKLMKLGTIFAEFPNLHAVGGRQLDGDVLVVHAQQKAMPVWHLPILSIMLVLGPFLACRIFEAVLSFDIASLGNVVVHVLHAILQGCDKALMRICFVGLTRVEKKHALNWI